MSTINTTSFSVDVSRFVEKTKVTGTQLFRAIALSALQLLIKKSPVDTGRFQGNWRVAINRVDKTVDYATYANFVPGAYQGTAGSQGKDAVMAGTKVLSAAVWTDYISISNNVHYAPQLEAGHSQRQAPMGVLRVTLIEIRNTIRQNLAILAKRVP